MKKRTLLVLGALVTAGVVAAPLVVARSREGARVEASLRDVPQSQRPLRVPSQARLLGAFSPDGLRVLEQSEKLTLLSVSPTPGEYDEPISAPPRPMFQGHAILKRVTLSGAPRDALLASFYDGLVLPYSAPAKPGQANLKQIGLGCFNPRHGIRAQSGGRTVDLLICFECLKFEVYADGKLQSRTQLSNRAPQPLFDSALAQARVPSSRN